MQGSAARIAVVTGASAGVGRAVALEFARRAWRVALIGRSTAGLEDACREIESAGGDAAAFPLDVADSGAVFAAAEAIVARFGTIDVWVNDAMVTMFAPVAQMTPDEFRRVTEVTYLGAVHGTMAALAQMRPRNAGTIVQVGSALSYRAIPLQSAYCGAKFALRAFTDSLRCELLHDRSAIRLTMVQLPAVNTPQFDWARNRTGRRVQPVPPIYRPEAIAVWIVRAATRPRREFWLGWPTLKAIAGAVAAPGLADRILAREGYEGQVTDEPQPAGAPDNLFEPARTGHRTAGRFSARARPRVHDFNRAARVGVVALALLTIAAISWAVVT